MQYYLFVFYTTNEEPKLSKRVEFCVNGSLAGNCRLVRSQDEQEETRRTPKPWHPISTLRAQRTNLQVETACSFGLIQHFPNPDMAGPVRHAPVEGITCLVAQNRGTDVRADR